MLNLMYFHHYVMCNYQIYVCRLLKSGLLNLPVPNGYHFIEKSNKEQDAPRSYL